MNFFKTVELENATRLLRISSVFKRFMLILPIMYIIYKDKGLTPGDFFLVQGIFAFSVFLLEIPTGYIGDLFSRKKVLVLSSLIYFSGYIYLFFAQGLWQVLVSELILGLSLSLESGTQSAYLYDILKKQNKERYAVKEEGRLKSYSIAGTAIATFLGGLLYSYLGEKLILLESSFVVLSLIILLFIPDIPEVKRIVKKGKSKWKDILDISKYAVNHKEIKWLMIFPAMFGTGTLFLMWGLQPLMEIGSIPLALFGIFIGLNQIFRTMFAHFAHRLLSKFKTKGFSILLFLILLGGFLSSILIVNTNNMIYSYIVYILLIVVGVAAASQAGLAVVNKSMINHRIKSDERATILSVDSMISGIFQCLLMIFAKFVIDGINFQAMFIIIGLIILPTTFWSMKKLLKLKLT